MEKYRVMYRLRAEDPGEWRDYYGYSLPLDMANRCRERFFKKYGKDYMFKVVHEKLVK